MPAKLGKPLDLTDEQKAAAAQVTQVDIVTARELWLKNAPAWAKGLVDAKERTVQNG